MQKFKVRFPPDVYSSGQRMEIEKFCKQLVSAEAEKAQEREKVLVEALQNIQKWCEESGLKNVALDNRVGMAVYHSLHLSRSALASYTQGKEAANG